MNHPVKPHDTDGSLVSMRYCLIATMIYVHLILIGKPGEGEGNPCGDHRASSPPAGRQGQSQDVETGPAYIMQRINKVGKAFLTWKYSPLKCNE